MSYPLLLTIAAALLFAFGAGFLLLPDLTVAPFGAALDPAGGLIARLYGAMHLGLGAIDWLARDVADVRVRRTIATGHLVYFAIGAAVATGGFVAGLANALILANAAAFLVLALAFGRYVVARDPHGSREASSRR
ncbi:MAG: hypothetical protein ACRDGE_10220 [Candidatus Limnocylindria bacterium]